MRAIHPLAALLALTIAAAPGCYNPGDLGDAPYKCTPDIPQCPDGYECDGRLCQRASGGGGMSITIPKTGMYGGMRIDPKLDGANCPDRDFEPNNSIGRATPIATGMLTGLAICPGGDIDIYHGSASGQFVRVTVNYQIQYGDLDLAIIDDHGNVKVGDGSARDNACVATSQTASGDLYIAVVGAGNKEVAPYTIKMDLGTSRFTCPSGASARGDGTDDDAQ